MGSTPLSPLMLGTWSSGYNSWTAEGAWRITPGGEGAEMMKIGSYVLRQSPGKVGLGKDMQSLCRGLQETRRPRLQEGWGGPCQERTKGSRGRLCCPVASEYLLDPVLCTQDLVQRMKESKREENVCISWGWIHRQERMMLGENNVVDGATPGKRPAQDGNHPCCRPHPAAHHLLESRDCASWDGLSSSHTLAFISHCFFFSLLRLPQSLQENHICCPSFHL